MKILIVTYIRPLEEVDLYIDAHMAWVEKGYADGLFLCSGRQEPRTGGVLLARGSTEQLQAYILLDPFVIHDVGSYNLIETVFSRAAEGYELLLG